MQVYSLTTQVVSDLVVLEVMTSLIVWVWNYVPYSNLTYVSLHKFSLALLVISHYNVTNSLKLQVLSLRSFEEINLSLVLTIMMI